MNLKAFAAAMLVVVGATGPSVARGMARPVIRLHDRVISVTASKFSATKVPGVVKAQLAVKMDNLGHRSLGVSASDFVVSAQGDIFSPQPWYGGHRRLTPGQSRVFPLTLTLPRAAMNEASLSYRPGQSRATSAIPISGLPRAIHRASSSSGTEPTINTFYTAGGVGEPWGTAIDRAGNVWFAEPGCDFEPTCSASAGPGQIGELTASSQTLAFYTLPNISGNQPIFLAFDGSGNLWFTTPDNSMIGEFNPSTGEFVGQWPVTPGSGPWDLTFVDGKIWYTEHLVSAVGSFDPSSHTYQDFQTPTANSNPYGIVANGGLIWFTENNSSADRIAVLNTRSNNAISEYPIMQPVSKSTPHLVAIDASGHPWWTEGWSDTIATLNPAAATPGQCGTTSGTCNGIQRFQPPEPTSCSDSGTHSSGIAVQGSTGLVWFDNSLTAQVGSFDPSSDTFAMTSLSSCNAHPHDGLGLDGTGSVWFDEEFANAIGELIPPPPTVGVPTVVTGSSSAVGTTSATVAGSVNPNGQATTYHFDYGTSSSYGLQAPASPDPSAGSGTTSQPVSANLAGLSPGTTYHYRLEATNASGTQYGSDQTFVTATSSVPTITSFSPTSAVAGSAVTISGTFFKGATAVAFNGTAASYTVNSANRITATVPAAASSGPISVTTPAGTATSSGSFTVVSASTVPPTPSNSAPPSISGTAQQGLTLAESHGSWANGVTAYAYQWEDCDASGSNCAAIAGATGQTYSLTGTDVGYTIRVQEIASNAGGSSLPVASSATDVVLPQVPSNTAVPSISGAMTQGQTLSESHGGWTNNPTSYSYQWEDCDSTGNNCAAIAGANGQTYRLTTSDLGHTVRVQEIAANAGGSSAPASSATAGLVLAASSPTAKPSDTSAPVISGETVRGQLLTASPGAWAGTPPISYAYQWQICDPGCSDIAGASDSFLRLSTTDVGAKLRVVVTAFNTAGTSQAVSGQTDRVRGVPTSAQIRARLRAFLSIAGHGATIAQLSKRDGYARLFDAPSAGHLVIRWYLATRNRTRIATASVTFPHAENVRVMIALTRLGRRLLAQMRSLKLIATASFAPSAGPATTVSNRITVKR
jgi:streptogramin lyase